MLTDVIKTFFIKGGSGALPLTVATLWVKVFLFFGCVSLLFAFKKKRNELGFGLKAH